MRAFGSRMCLIRSLKAASDLQHNSKPSQPTVRREYVDQNVSMTLKTIRHHAANYSGNPVQQREEIQQGATTTEYQVQKGAYNMPLYLRHSEGSWLSIQGTLRGAPALCFPHSSFSPPFHRATACPTITGRTQRTPRRSSDRKRAWSSSRMEERLDCREPMLRGFVSRMEERLYCREQTQSGFVALQ